MITAITLNYMGHSVGTHRGCLRLVLDCGDVALI
jgi:hypothetical protein